MPLRDDIRMAQTVAQKARDAFKTDALRNVWSAIRNEEIDVRHDLSDDETVALVGRLVKQLRDALLDFRAGGREDLVEKNEREISLLETFLPPQLSDEELRVAVEKAIGAVGANSPDDVGKVMGSTMKEVKGKADGNRVRAVAMMLLDKK